MCLPLKLPLATGTGAAPEPALAVLEAAASWGRSEKRNCSHRARICAWDSHGVPDDRPNLQSDLEWMSFLPRAQRARPTGTGALLREGGGLGGDRRELAEQEQTILHSHVLQGGKHVLWPPRQSFLGSKTGRNPLNTTPQHKAAFAKNLALA